MRRWRVSRQGGSGIHPEIRLGVPGSRLPPLCRARAAQRRTGPHRQALEEATLELLIEIGRLAFAAAALWFALKGIWRVVRAGMRVTPRVVVSLVLAAATIAVAVWLQLSEPEALAPKVDAALQSLWEWAQERLRSFGQWVGDRLDLPDLPDLPELGAASVTAQLEGGRGQRLELPGPASLRDPHASALGHRLDLLPGQPEHGRLVRRTMTHHQRAVAIRDAVDYGAQRHAEQLHLPLDELSVDRPDR